MEAALIKRQVEAAICLAKEALQGLRPIGPGEDFNVRGDLYRLALELAPEARERELELIFTALKPQQGEIGMELAAGNGFLTRHLVAKTEATLFAVDPSREQLKDITRWDPKIVPLCEIPEGKRIVELIEPSCLSFVTSVGGVHHIEDHEALFRNVAQLLAPGGRFVVADVCAETNLSRHFDRVVANKCITGHFANWLDSEKVKNYASIVGLEVFECKQTTPYWRFDDLSQMALFFKALHAYDLPLEDIERDVRTELNVTCGVDGVRVEWPLLVFDVRKRR